MKTVSIEKMIEVICEMIKKESGVDLLKQCSEPERDAKGRFVKKSK